MHKLARHLLALTAVTAVVSLVASVHVAIARTDAEVQAINQEHCQRMQSTLNDMQRQDRGMADEIAALQRQIDLAQSGSAVNIDQMVGQTLAEVRSLRKSVASDQSAYQNLKDNYSIWQSVWLNGSTKQQATGAPRYEAAIERSGALLNRDAVALKEAEKRLDYWTQRETEVASGGVVGGKSSSYVLSELKFRQKQLLQDRPQLQRDMRSLQSTIAMVCSSVASSKPTSKSGENETWSGTWSRNEAHGDMILHQAGDVVSGHFTWNDASGKISGLVSGPLLSGTFTDNHYQGTYSLTLRGRQFTGSYRGINKDSHGPISGSFSGTCIAGDCLRNR